MYNKTSTPLMLIYLVLLYVIRSNAISSNSCSDDSVRLVINSRRNETNHRNVQVELTSNRAIQNVKEDDNDINLIIDHNSSYCQGREIIIWKVNIDGKKVMSTPPKGYEYKSGLGYYKLYREPRNWDEARKVCEQDGAHIIIIDSENELNMMTKLPNLSQYTWDNAQWAGFHDHFTEGEYTTLLGEPLSTTWYKVWLPGEPRNEARPPDQGSHCGGFFDFKLDGVPCSGKIPFICELI